MGITICDIYVCLVSITLIVLIYSLVLYKKRLIPVHSWESAVLYVLDCVRIFFGDIFRGIKKFTKNEKVRAIADDFANELVMGWTGKELPSEAIRTNLFLDASEEIGLIKCLSDLFETPVFNPISGEKGKIVYDISATGLVSRYSELTNSQIGEKAWHIVKGYFQKARGEYVEPYIITATPKRLLFKIPLNERAKRELQNYQNQYALPESSQKGKIHESLEIEVPELEDDDEIEIF